MKRMIFLVVAGLLSLAVSSQAAVLTFTSDPGNWVGQGLSFSSGDLLSGADSEAYSYGMRNFGDNGAHFHLQWIDADNNYHSGYFLDLTAPGNNLLQVGRYDGATRYPFQEADSPGMAFGGEGRLSNTSWGYFDILEIEYEEYFYPSKLAVDFVNYETTAYAGSEPDFSKGLYGQLRYNSSVPLSNPVPLPAAFWLFGSGIAGIFALKKRGGE